MHDGDLILLALILGTALAFVAFTTLVSLVDLLPHPGHERPTHNEAYERGTSKRTRVPTRSRVLREAQEIARLAWERTEKR